MRVRPEIQALPRPDRVSPAAAKAVDRAALRRAYRPAEDDIVAERLTEAHLSPAELDEATAIARTLVKGVRAHKPAGIDAFMQTYDLGSEEGVAMMCLAEALLRIPDAHTADELIADKLAGPDWSDKLGDSGSAFVNAATFSLLLTGKVLEGAQDRSDNWRAAISRAVGRLGEPVDPHRGRRGDEDPRPQFRVRPDHRRSAQARQARAQARPQPQFRHARRGGADDGRRQALRQSLCRRARPHRQQFRRRLQVGAGDFGQAVGAPSAVRIFACRGGAGGDPAGDAQAGAESEQGRRPFDHRCRGSGPARAADGRVRGAARRR